MNKKMRDLLAKIKSKTEEARQHNEAGEVDLVKACLDEVDNLKGEYETEKRLFEAEQDERPRRECRRARTELSPPRPSRTK